MPDAIHDMMQVVSKIAFSVSMWMADLRWRSVSQEEEEWNELLQGSSSVDDNAAADMAPALDLATAAALAEQPVGAAEPAAAVDGPLVSDEEGAGSGVAVPADQNGAAPPLSA